MDSAFVGSSEGKAELRKVRSAPALCGTMAPADTILQMEDTTKKHTAELDTLYEQMKSKIEAELDS